MPSVISRPKTRHSLPAVWMRAGTSKGLYLHRNDLPPNQKDWSPVLARAMGSYDSDPRQLNGIGGATSTTSKVAIVSKSRRPGIDVDYMFVQCSVGSPNMDFTGNCGNIASGVGPFALDEGLVDVFPGQKEVDIRVFNTNTNSTLTETIEVDETGHFLEDGEYEIPGIFSRGSSVKMAFVKPAGSMTGSILPSGRPTNVLHVKSSPASSPIPIRVSAVDAANPFIFVDGSTLPDSYHRLGPHAKESLVWIESIRRKGAVLMGLARDEEQASLTRGTPKIAVLSSPKQTLDAPEIEVTSFSMGKVHGSLQLTGAVCLASAACIEGTIAHQIRQQRLEERPESVRENTQKVKLRHPGGNMEVDVRLDLKGGVEAVTVFRTARRLFEGRVYYLM